MASEYLQYLQYSGRSATGHFLSTVLTPGTTKEQREGAAVDSISLVLQGFLTGAFTSMNANATAKQEVQGVQQQISEEGNVAQISANTYQPRLQQFQKNIDGFMAQINANLKKVEDTQDAKKKMDEEIKAIQAIIEENKEKLNSPDTPKEEKQNILSDLSALAQELSGYVEKSKALSETITQTSQEIEQTQDQIATSEKQAADTADAAQAAQNESQAKIDNLEQQAKVVGTQKAAENTAQAAAGKGQIAQLEAASTNPYTVAATQAKIAQIQTTVVNPNEQAAQTRQNGMVQMDSSATAVSGAIQNYRYTIGGEYNAIVGGFGDTYSSLKEYIDSSNAVGSLITEATDGIQADSENLNKAVADAVNQIIQKDNSEENEDPILEFQTEYHPVG